MSIAVRFSSPPLRGGRSWLFPIKNLQLNWSMEEIVSGFFPKMVAYHRDDLGDC